MPVGIRVLTGFLVFSMFGACSKEGEQPCAEGACPAENDRTPLEMDEFCPAFEEAYCAHVEACGCGTGAGAKCREEVNCDEWFLPLQRAVEENKLTFNVEAASELLRKLRSADASCGESAFSLGFDSLTAHSFGGVFVGTRDLGSPCTMPVGHKISVSDCREGLCLGKEGSGVCTALVGEDGACDVDDASKRICFLVKPPDVDAEFESARDAVRCTPKSPGSSEGVCRSSLSIGSACDDSDQCSSDYCAKSVCAAKLPDGAVCESPGQCASARCEQHCLPKVENGAACRYDSDCVSSKCYSDWGSPGVCGDPRRIGAACEQDFQCETKLCSAGECKARVCKGFRD